MNRDPSDRQPLWTWLRWALWRLVMRVAHRYHWHHTRTAHPENDTMEICDWCGGRWVTHYGGTRGPVEAHFPAGMSFKTGPEELLEIIRKERQS